MNIIFLLHLLFVLFIVAVPVVSVSIQLLFLHIALLTCVVVHWGLNNDVCCLTLMEQRLYRDKAKKDLFLQRLVGPVYNVTNRDIKRGTYIILLFSTLKLALLTRNYNDMCLKKIT